MSIFSVVRLKKSAAIMRKSVTNSVQIRDLLEKLHNIRIVLK